MTALPAPLVRVTRGDRIESVHYGLLALVDPEGRLLQAHGPTDEPVILRSAGKPFQAAQFVASGAAERFGVSAAELAVVIGSHGGTVAHVAEVRRLLARGPLDDALLGCGIHPPFDPLARKQAGSAPNVLQNNCSGKHAAMLLGCHAAGWSLADYLDPGHPWQRAIAALLAGLAGIAPVELASVTDGCSAPSFVMPARAAARAFAQLAAREDRTLAAIWAAATTNPVLVAGEGRIDTDLMLAAPGRVLSKVGAEGVLGLALRTDNGPRGALIKISDGDDKRARVALAIDLVAQQLALPTATLTALRARHVPPITTLRGVEVGRVTSTLESEG